MSSSPTSPTQPLPPPSHIGKPSSPRLCFVARLETSHLSSSRNVWREFRVKDSGHSFPTPFYLLSADL